MGKRVVIYCRSAGSDDCGAEMQKQSALLREQARRENMDIAAEVDVYKRQRFFNTEHSLYGSEFSQSTMITSLSLSSMKS